MQSVARNKVHTRNNNNNNTATAHLLCEKKAPHRRHTKEPRHHAPPRPFPHQIKLQSHQQREDKKEKNEWGTKDGSFLDDCQGNDGKRLRNWIAGGHGLGFTVGREEFSFLFGVLSEGGEEECVTPSSPFFFLFFY